MRHPVLVSSLFTLAFACAPGGDDSPDAAGATDAGSTADAGTSVDAGDPADAGSTPDAGEAADTTPPVPPGAPTLVQQDGTSVRVTFAAATDDHSAASALEYYVAHAPTADDLVSVDDVLSATRAMDWSPLPLSVTIAGLAVRASVSVAVLVRDEARNVAKFPVTSTTLAPPRGALDTAFGTSGHALVLPPEVLDFTGVALAADSGGALALVGNSTVSDRGAPAVVRLSSTGAVQAAGTVVLPIGTFVSGAVGAAFSSTGRLLVGAYGTFSNATDFAMLAFDATGQPDAAFGTAGVAYRNFGVGGDTPGALFRVSDERWVLAGSALTAAGSNYDYALAAFDATGQPDAAFGSQGSVTHSVVTFDEFRRAERTPQGRFVLLGASADGGATLVAFTAAGTLDTTFGSGGVATVSFEDVTLELSGIASDASGGLLVAGVVTGGSTRPVAVFKLDVDGDLVAPFGGAASGLKTFDAPGVGWADIAGAQAIDAGWVVFGSAANENDDDALLARLGADGDLDAAFDGDGLATYHFGGSESARAVVRTADGSGLVVGGYAAIEGPNRGLVFRVVP